MHDWRTRAACPVVHTRRDVDAVSLDWRSQAACLDHDPERWFPLEKDWSGVARAKAVCSGCPVRASCLEAGLSEAAGVWGGLDPAERAGLRFRMEATGMEATP